MRFALLRPRTKGVGIAAATLLLGVPLLFLARSRSDAFCKPTVYRIKQLQYEAFGNVVARVSESYHSPIQAEPAKIAQLAEEGASVKVGDLLAVLDSSGEEKRLGETRDKLNTARTDHDNLVAKSKVETEKRRRKIAELERGLTGAKRDVESYIAVEAGIREAQITSRLRDAERQLEERTQRVEVMQEFFAKGFASTVELERAKRDLEAGQGQLLQAQQEQRLFVEFERARETEKRQETMLQLSSQLEEEHGAGETEARETAAKLADLSKQIADLGQGVKEIEDRIAACTIRTKVQGVVVYGTVYQKEMGLRPVRVGDSVSFYETIVSVTDLHEVDLACTVPEEQMHDLTKDLEASLYLTAEPLLPLRGRVREVGNVGAGTGAGLQRLITVRVGVLEPPAWVRPGMTGKARILVHTFENAVVVPYSAVAFEGEKAYVFKQGLLRTSKRAIVVKGLLDEGIVVAEGLSANDSILREVPAR